VRRLAVAVGDMRWGQVILELALLIAGILIALAVDGWMDGRRLAQSPDVAPHLAHHATDLHRPDQHR
jgi:hypothetical protein